MLSHSRKRKKESPTRTSIVLCSCFSLILLLINSSINRSSSTNTLFVNAFTPPMMRPLTSNNKQYNTKLNMVFDFFKDRTKEGLDQLSNLADASYKGQLGKGLTDVAQYTKETNEKFANGLALSRNRLLSNLDNFFGGAFNLSGLNNEEVLEELIDVLLQADLGMKTAEDIVNEVKSLQQASTKSLSKDDLISIMRGKLIEILSFEDIDNDNEENDDNDEEVVVTSTSSAATSSSSKIRFASSEDYDVDTYKKYGSLTVLFIMGANGMGKTTTIGKLAHRLKEEGNQTVLMAACDTFRAGAIEQLEMWSDRADVDCYSPDNTKTSPSSVLYNALDKAIKENYDTLLVDTSGRLSNNDALTDELNKMKKVIQRRMSVESNEDGKPIPNINVPHETLLVIDAAQGRMALDSAKTWNDEVGLTGLILTKLDGSAKGGSVVAISRELNLPVKLIGVGESINDLRDFEPERFVDGLLGIGDAGGSYKTKSKSSKSGINREGELLASRLSDLRKARDDSAKKAKQEAKDAEKKEKERELVGATAASASGNSITNELTFQEMDSGITPITPLDGGSSSTGGLGGTTKKSKSNKKKKKKRKGRK